MENISTKNGSNDPQKKIVMTIETDAENEASGTLNNNSNEEEEYVFSSMNYDEALDHLMEISKEFKDSKEVTYSKPYFTSLFEALVELSEFQPERMERTLSIIGLICEAIEYKLLSINEVSMWDIDGEFSFPIPKEKIQMSLDGLVTPYEWEDKENLDYDIDSSDLDVDISKMDYAELINHLTESIKDMDGSTEVPYSREHFTELFEALIGLSEFQPERMERTLVILGLAFNQIEFVRQSRGAEPLWGYDNNFNFPIPKEKIQMSLDGLETPYDWDEPVELDPDA